MSRRDRVASEMLFGYDPVRDLPADHLARLVDLVVDEALPAQGAPTGPGQPAYSPRVYAKVLIYGYATGERSSRQLERLCRESLPYLLLARGEAPCYRSLCRFRVEHPEAIAAGWASLFGVAARLGMGRVGRIVVDSGKLRANAAPESVLTEAEYGPVQEALARALVEAEAADAAEGEGGGAGETRTGQPVERAQMRDLVREVRARLAGRPVPEAPTRMSRRMRRQVRRALAALEEAQAEGRKHLCVSDPEARMMHGGRDRRIVERYALEVAVDQGAGLLVACSVTAEGNDNGRLRPLVAAAQEQEPEGIVAVEADSGYYHSHPVRELLEAGVDLCIPDTQTAGALHRGESLEPAVAMVYEAEADQYRCPQGNVLGHVSTRRKERGYEVAEYRAQGSCRECPLAGVCFRSAARRRDHKQLCRVLEGALLEEARARFRDPAHQQRYRKRGSWIEGVFGFVKGALGYERWLLRGQEKVTHEGRLMGLAYQLRHVHKVWAAQAS
jgi:hypothetical protein